MAGFPRATPSYSVAAWVLIQASELGAPIANLLSTETLGGGWALYASSGRAARDLRFRYATNPRRGLRGRLLHGLRRPRTPGRTWRRSSTATPSTLTLYVNGVATTVAHRRRTILPGSTSLYMARSAELTPTFPLTGALDDVAIYDRARWSAEEVAELVAGEPVPNPQ